ncbi:unnamed protein product [Amoebophrya sp. A120]|nr:unnamed protein product [Amoebophrya sp. A120]|eukprot:GSA120T00021748001.1
MKSRAEQSRPRGGRGAAPARREDSRDKGAAAKSTKNHEDARSRRQHREQRSREREDSRRAARAPGAPASNSRDIKPTTNKTTTRATRLSTTSSGEDDRKKEGRIARLQKDKQKQASKRADSGSSGRDEKLPLRSARDIKDSRDAPRARRTVENKRGADSRARTTTNTTGACDRQRRSTRAVEDVDLPMNEDFSRGREERKPRERTRDLRENERQRRRADSRGGKRSRDRSKEQEDGRTDSGRRADPQKSVDYDDIDEEKHHERKKPPPANGRATAGADHTVKSEGAQAEPPPKVKNALFQPSLQPKAAPFTAASNFMNQSLIMGQNDQNTTMSGTTLPGFPTPPAGAGAGTNQYDGVIFFQQMQMVQMQQQILQQKINQQMQALQQENLPELQHVQQSDNNFSGEQTMKNEKPTPAEPKPALNFDDKLQNLASRYQQKNTMSKKDQKKKDLDILLEEMKQKTKEQESREKITIEVPKTKEQHRFIDIVAQYVAKCGYTFEEQIRQDVKEGILNFAESSSHAAIKLHERQENDDDDEDDHKQNQKNLSDSEADEDIKEVDHGKEEKSSESSGEDEAGGDGEDVSPITAKKSSSKKKRKKMNENSPAKKTKTASSSISAATTTTTSLVNADFLLDPRDPNYAEKEALYYKWRVYAYTQGDERTRWRTEPFQMVRNGPVFIPPKIPEAFYYAIPQEAGAYRRKRRRTENGTEEEILEEKKSVFTSKEEALAAAASGIVTGVLRGGPDSSLLDQAGNSTVQNQMKTMNIREQLDTKWSNQQSTRKVAGQEPLDEEGKKELEQLIGQLKMTRKSIYGAMAILMERFANSAKQATAEFLCDKQEFEKFEEVKDSAMFEYNRFLVDSAIARMYLISDLLQNASSLSQPRAWCYRKELEQHLPEMFWVYGKILYTQCNPSTTSSGNDEKIKKRNKKEGNRNEIDTNLSGAASGFNMFSAQDYFKTQSTSTSTSSLTNDNKRFPQQYFAGRICRILAAWQESCLFSPMFLQGLKATFLLSFSREISISDYKECSRMSQKRKEWAKFEHFSQLEKLCRERGLLCKNPKAEEPEGAAAKVKKNKHQSEKEKAAAKDREMTTGQEFLVEQLAMFEYLISNGNEYTFDEKEEDEEEDINLLPEKQRTASGTVSSGAAVPVPVSTSSSGTAAAGVPVATAVAVAKPVVAVGISIARTAATRDFHEKNKPVYGNLDGIPLSKELHRVLAKQAERDNWCQCEKLRKMNEEHDEYATILHKLFVSNQKVDNKKWREIQKEEKRQAAIQKAKAWEGYCGREADMEKMRAERRKLHENLWKTEVQSDEKNKKKKNKVEKRRKRSQDRSAASASPRESAEDGVEDDFSQEEVAAGTSRNRKRRRRDGESSSPRDDEDYEHEEKLQRLQSVSSEDLYAAKNGEKYYNEDDQEDYKNYRRGNDSRKRDHRRRRGQDRWRADDNGDHDNASHEDLDGQAMSDDDQNDDDRRYNSNRYNRRDRDQYSARNRSNRDDHAETYESGAAYNNDYYSNHNEKSTPEATNEEEDEDAYASYDFHGTTTSGAGTGTTISRADRREREREQREQRDARDRERYQDLYESRNRGGDRGEQDDRYRRDYDKKYDQNDKILDHYENVVKETRRRKRDSGNYGKREERETDLADRLDDPTLGPMDGEPMTDSE